MSLVGVLSSSKIVFKYSVLASDSNKIRVQVCVSRDYDAGFVRLRIYSTFTNFNFDNACSMVNDQGFAWK